ncbi:hypothetical protein Q5P01_011592 [Channa striata]|uniref:Ig-like domain-containing protein n=1 Tax=Channa striata TaxID=64152 RepID=A0AA88STJ7_CHASR|nr:hypothetical protein Q5P01_011592 [Channa striata]
MRMFVSVLLTLLFSVRDNDANTVISFSLFTDFFFLGGNKVCPDKYCITLSEGDVTAEAGLCVVLPCSFTTDDKFNTTEAAWYKCDQPPQERCDKAGVTIFNSSNNEQVQSGFKGRVSLLEPELSLKNCSIIINDLNVSDSGSYQLRVGGILKEKKDGWTFIPTTTVKVSGLSQKPTVTVPPLTEGHQTTLTCTAPGLCSGSVPEITWTWRGAGVQDSHITGNITDSKTETLTAVTQRHTSTLNFDPSADHHGTEVTCKVKFTGNITTEETVTLNVSHLQKPVITGITTVKEGDDLNLTCAVESFPPSVLTWTKHGSNKTIENRTATLFITNVTQEDSGRYICSAEHQIKALTAQTDVTVTVTFGPKIFNDSSCVNQSDVLTCVCVSEGVPLPTIRWPLLETHTEYSVTNTVSNHTVTSRIRLSLSAHSTTTFECVSRNDNGQTKHNVSVKNESQPKNFFAGLLTNIKWLHVIPAFFIGILFSVIVTCLSRKCNRKKQSSVNLTENVEMATTQTIPLVDADQAITDEITRHPKEVEYTDIDVSKLKRKSPTEDKETRRIPDTEYAEVKKEKRMESQDNDREEGDTMGVYEEAAVMIVDDKESEKCVQTEEEGGEDVALYSNVNEIMTQI